MLFGTLACTEIYPWPRRGMLSCVGAELAESDFLRKVVQAIQVLLIPAAARAQG